MELWKYPVVDGAFEKGELVRAETYASADFKGLRALAKRFLADCSISVPASPPNVIAACCLAMCGHFHDEQVAFGPELPNQPPTWWKAFVDDLTTGELEGVILSARLVNDFVAVGLGLLVVDPKDIVVLHNVAKVEGAAMAGIGAGTGLGKVYLTREHPGKEYVAWPSEGGCLDFTAHNQLEWELRQYLWARDGHVTVEGVVSGPGLQNIHQFLSVRSGTKLEDYEALEAREIGQRALDRSDDICVQAVEMMMSSYAAECRSLAIHHLPLGGIYICGGLAPKLLPFVKEILARAYLENELMNPIVALCPLYVVTNEFLGVLGARLHAFRRLTTRT